MKKHLLFSLCSALAIIVFVFINCNRSGTADSKSTDVVNITGINSFIKDADIKAGVKKAEDQVEGVRLSHVKHEKAGVKCITCHHKEGNDERIKTCAECHKGKAGEDTMHNFCINCHKEKKSAPTACDECHRFEPAKK